MGARSSTLKSEIIKSSLMSWLAAAVKTERATDASLFSVCFSLLVLCPLVLCVELCVCSVGAVLALALGYL